MRRRLFNLFNCPHFIDEFLAIVKPLNVKTALEVGCLSGELKDALAGIGVKCDGIELNPRRKDVIKGDFFTYPLGHYDLVFSSGVLEHYPREDAVKMVGRMSELGTYVLNFVPNRDCKAYMTARSNTTADWKDELPYDELELVMSMPWGMDVQSGHAGKEWSKRFGGDGSQAYLVWCLGRKP